MHGVLEDHSSPLKFWVPPKVTNFLISPFLIQPKISSPLPLKFFGADIMEFVYFIQLATSTMVEWWKRF